MKNKKIKKNSDVIDLGLIIFFGLIGALTLQAVWLRNTYILIRDSIQKENYSVIEKALQEEGNIRFRMTPKGTAIESGPTNDTIPAMTYFYERISDMGYPMSLDNLDSITFELLKKSGVEDNYSIYVLNLSGGKLLNSIHPIKESSWMTIKTDPFPIRTDYTEAIQLVIGNPYKTFFERMGLLLIATAVIMIFVIGCIIYQINLIFRFRKILQIREDFSYALIHDMKTPLSTILATLSFLRSGRLDDKPVMKANYYRIAENEADHLLTLTNKVLTLSKLEHQKLEMFKSTFALEPMVEKLTEKFRTKSTKPVRFEVNLQAPEIYADEEYLEGVLSNLIDNAIKYSKASVEIEISSERTEQYTLLKVRDNGLGISEADQRIIFAKYERAAASKRNRKGGAAGFGLGLNFVEQVVTAHEGKILVNSIEGDFTEFTIYLPHQTATT
ncbi:MAG: sensor histidine kinase [Phocaeicola sp.]